MDAGGSMDPYARMVSQLFSAASQMNHFKEFKHYYFHNCVYEDLYEDIWMDRRLPTGDLFRGLDASWRVIFVGDAAMAPRRVGQSLRFHLLLSSKRTSGDKLA